MGARYELIILGAGPAGITASVYAARKKLNSLVISGDIGGQAAWSGEVQNYTGYQFIRGEELALKFQEHMKAFDIKVNVPEQAMEIRKEDSFFRVLTEKTDYSARTVIVATGKRPKLMEVEGEEFFKNRGVSYCATCDGPLFRDKSVIIAGGGNAALDAAMQMMKISPEVFIVNSAEKLTADAVMVDKVEAALNVKIWNSSRILKIYGDKFMRGVKVMRGGETVDLPARGLFVEIGLIPNSDCAGILKKNNLGEIIVSNQCDNSTNVPGIFAAGDVTNVQEKQIIIACGEGAKASLAAFKYVSRHVA